MSAGVTSAGFGVTCPHCGLTHKTTCPRISAIEYETDGTIRRVEFHGPQPIIFDPRAIQYIAGEHLLNRKTDNDQNS